MPQHTSSAPASDSFVWQWSDEEHPIEVTADTALQRLYEYAVDELIPSDTDDRERFAFLDACRDLLSRRASV